MKAVKMFGKNVMVEQRAKGVTGIIHLPDNMDTTNKDLFEDVVIGVGDEVSRVKEGDIIMFHFSPGFATPHPLTGKAVVVIHEDLIQGLVVGS